jgi:hypothetical protein
VAAHDGGEQSLSRCTCGPRHFGKVVPPETLCGIEIWPASIAMTAATMSYLRIVHRWWRAKSCQ